MSVLEVALASCVPLSPLPQQPARCRVEVRPSAHDTDDDDDLIAIEEACHDEWTRGFEVAEDDGQSTATSRPGMEGSHLRTPRLTKDMLMNDDLVWKKRIIPASRLPELLSRQQELRQNKKPTKGLGASNVQARERWSRAVASVTDSEGVDRTMSRVRNISKKVRSAMFYEDSGFSVLKMGNMLAAYHRAYEHKRYHRLNPFFDDVRGLSAPLDSMFESRAYEIVETMQLELSHSLQNELVRRAEPVELQRLDREADNILEQCQVSKKNMDVQLADLQAAVNKAASEAARFLDVARTELGALAADIADFTAQHNHLRKADIDYQADLFDQQRRNDALQDQLEKLTARRRLAETRLQADMESLRTENTVLKRSMGALSNLSKDNKKRLTEISNWMSVLCGRHLERNHETMLMAYQKRVVRRQAFYERIAWVQLQHLRVVVEKLSKLLVERQEELKIARTRQEVRLYRRLTVEACCLLYEVRLRSGELQKDGSLTQNEAIEECLKKGKMKHRPTGLMMFFAKELGKPLKWMRQRHMEVSFSKDLVFSGSDSVSTPLSLMEPGQFLMRQREIQLGVIRGMRRASNPLETKVADITNRFKQKMLQKRMTLKEGKVDGFDDVSSAEEEEEPEFDHSATMEPVDPEAIKAILQSDYKSFFEPVQAPAQVGVTEAAVDMPEASATEQAAVETADASPPVDAAQALEDLFGLAKAQETLEQTSSSLLLQLSAVPGAQDAVASFADLLEDLTTALRIGYIGASCLSDPANPRATPWKLRPHQLPWLPGHAALCAERCGVLRAVTAVLEGALPNLSAEPEVDEAGNEVGEASPISTKAISEAAAEAATSTLASVANFLVSLPPIATAEMTEVSEQCMIRVEKGLRRYFHLQNTACDACAQIQLSPGINLTSTEGKAEALPLGPSPHSFMTSSKGLQLLMDSKELASSDALTKLTEVEILDVLHTAARREYHLAMPECFRASVLALAVLGGLFEDVSRLETPMLPPEAVAGRSSPYQPGLWRFLAARRGPGVAGFLSPPDASGELNATDPFHLDASMRNLSSRERAGTATDSSRPWTSTPRRPSTQDSTRLPSRQTGLGLTEPSEFESALMQLAGEKLHPSLDEDLAHEGEAGELETEEQRLEAERQAQEEEAANLENESEELQSRIQGLRDRIARIAEQGGDASGEAWRMGDLMAEAAQAEELQEATRKTMQHRLHVAKLVKDQQARRKKQKDLLNELKRLTQEASQQVSKAPSEASDIGHLPSMGGALSEKEVARSVSGGSTGRQKSKLRTSSRQSSRQASFSRQITPGSDRLEKDLAVRSRLAEIEEALAQLNLDIQLGETEEKNLEAEVESLEQERATRLEESDSVGAAKAEQMPEEAMVAAYCSRVSQRSLWKVVIQKHKKARQAAKDYVAGLTASKSQVLEVPGEEVVATSSLRSQKSNRAALQSDASSRPSKGPSGRSSRRPPSKPRSATSAGGRSTSNRRANSKPASATSSPRMASPRRQAPKAAASPVAKAAASKGGAGIFVGAGAGSTAKPSTRRTLTVNMGNRKTSTSSLRRSSIESRRESEENADGLNDVMRVGGASPRPTGEVPVIAVKPPSSSGSSSGSWSTTSSEQDLDGKASPEPVPQPEPVVPQTRRANVMTGLLETKALRQEVQLSLGEQEIQKTNQWLDKWINGTTEEDEVGPPETSRSRRIGMVQDLSDWAKDISPLLVSSTLGLDLGKGEAGELEVQKSASERSRSSDRSPRSRSPKAEAQSLVARNMRLMSTAGPDSSLMLFAKQGRGGQQRRLVSTAGGPQQRRKSPKKGKRGVKSRQGQLSSSDGTDAEQEAYRIRSGFLADPAVSKLRTQPHAPSQPSKRREHSTSTALPSRGNEGLQDDSLVTLSSESVERHRFLSRNAISAAVAEHGEGQEQPRWKLPKGPLPKLVDVRKTGPGDAEAAKRAEKGHKASVSAAMVQAARMQPKRLRTPSKTAAEKPLSQAESRASLTEAKAVHFNQDPVEQSQDYEILSGERSSESPARSSRSGRSSRGGARSMSRPSSGWSLAESETGPVLSTFPKECKPPSLSARSKRVFSSHG